MADVKIFADYIEDAALKQIERLSTSNAYCDQVIRIMPDVHVGSGCVVGFTSTLDLGIIDPFTIGVDIGCGVLSVETTLKDAERSFKKMDAAIRSSIPYGKDHHLEPDTLLKEAFIDRLSYRMDDGGINASMRSMGTLGGGNHFIELDKHPETKKLWLTVHTGSRGFGFNVAKHHQEIALGNDGYITGSAVKDYLSDLAIAQEFAHQNRIAIVACLQESLHFKVTDSVESVHNYIDMDSGIIRKGAISAHKGEQVVVPLNMEAGIMLGEGKGLVDWNYSAPHGAGRMMSRAQARAKLSLSQFRKDMKGVWSSTISKRTIDEAPRAYKNIGSITKQLRTCLTDVAICETVYSFKAD